jgi:uncharacterized MAPEG superfamily protein
MTDILLATLAFYLFQLVLPTLIAVARGEANLPFLVGGRDTDIEHSIPVRRAQRASNNMVESLLVFLPLAALGIANNAAIAETATIWLALRVAYLITYLTGVSYIRTFIWFGSVYCLIVMALALV